MPALIEMHLTDTAPEFTRQYGRKVKALGGRYSDVRGHVGKRYVTVPATPAGIELAEAIVESFGAPEYRRERGGATCTVIVRPQGGGDTRRKVGSTVSEVQLDDAPSTRLRRVFAERTRELARLAPSLKLGAKWHVLDVASGDIVGAPDGEQWRAKPMTGPEARQLVGAEWATRRRVHAANLKRVQTELRAARAHRELTALAVQLADVARGAVDADAAAAAVRAILAAR